MKRISFCDKFQLTKAVLEGRKTMTRRMVPSLPPISVNGKLRSIETMYMEHEKLVVCCGSDLLLYAPNHCQPKFKVGEVVAVAQSYKDTGNYPESYIIDELHPNIEFEAGWNNKMFVRADLMIHQIRITNVRVERLQDISYEDCLNEGIKFYNCGIDFGYKADGVRGTFGTARDAFAALIDKISGKGTWKSNPWIFVYEFELVR